MEVVVIGDEEMEVETVIFEAHEIDIGYEFEAAMFFDFTREETPDEASQAEAWFHCAKSYPPSPFVSKLVIREEIVMTDDDDDDVDDDDDEDGNVNEKGSPKPSRDKPSCSSLCVGVSQEFCEKDVNKNHNNRDCEGPERGVFGNLPKVLDSAHGMSTGLYNYFNSNKLKGKTNAAIKTTLPRSSTLMKPTASQLAKRNHVPQDGGSRFQVPLVQNNEKSLCTSSGVENQAPKRQKLDGGHIRKVNDGKHHTNFVHKIPKRDETLDKITVNAKLKLTIPREPDLETAHRAQRIRPRDGTEVEQVKSTVRRFKARPFNKKIFEAPTLPLPKRSIPKLPEFKVFQLKTMERANKNAPAVSFSNLCKESDKELDKPSTSTSTENRNMDYRRSNITEVPKSDGDEVHRFKALPLNKRIFSSRGDIGIFRNSKREATVPMEFNLNSEKKVEQNPPTDLFVKLSLTSEHNPNNGSSHQLKLPWSNTLSVKGSKENLDSFQPENKMMMSDVAEKPSIFSRKQVACRGNGGIFDIGNKIHTRSWGVRWE